jgi:hypothetical protein
MEKCPHEWVVFDICHVTGDLLLGCDKCEALSTVADPSEEEERAAWTALSDPFDWHDNDRVTMIRTVAHRRGGLS